MKFRIPLIAAFSCEGVDRPEFSQVCGVDGFGFVCGHQGLWELAVGDSAGGGVLPQDTADPFGTRILCFLAPVPIERHNLLYFVHYQRFPQTGKRLQCLECVQVSESLDFLHKMFEDDAVILKVRQALGQQGKGGDFVLVALVQCVHDVRQQPAHANRVSLVPVFKGRPLLHPNQLKVLLGELLLELVQAVQHVLALGLVVIVHITVAFLLVDDEPSVEPQIEGLERLLLVQFVHLVVECENTNAVVVVERQVAEQLQEVGHLTRCTWRVVPLDNLRQELVQDGVIVVFS